MLSGTCFLSHSNLGIYVTPGPYLELQRNGGLKGMVPTVELFSPQHVSKGSSIHTPFHEGISLLFCTFGLFFRVHP